MKLKDDLVFVKHILEELHFLRNNTKDLTFNKFIADETLKRACARSLEIIGEATKNISPEFKKKHKEIEWRKLSGLRDKIIHHYFGVSWDIVWDVIENKTSELKRKIEDIIKKVKR